MSKKEKYLSPFSPFRFKSDAAVVCEIPVEDRRAPQKTRKGRGRAFQCSDPVGVLGVIGGYSPVFLFFRVIRAPLLRFTRHSVAEILPPSIGLSSMSSQSVALNPFRVQAAVGEEKIEEKISRGKV